MKQYWFKFQKTGKIISSFIFLHLAYYLGIGVTSLVAKLFGKRFLNNNPTGSTWEKINQEHNLERMY